MKSMLILFLALVSGLVHAHPGHDHGHWLSEPIHVLTLIAIISVVVAGFAIHRVLNKKSEEK